MKKNKIPGILVFVVLFVSLLTMGCNKNQEEKQEEKQLKIGFSFDSLVIERWQRDRDIFISRAGELGAGVNVQNAGGEVSEQKKQIQYFVKQGMDVIVIAAVDTKALTAEIQEAKKKGIKVVAYDRLIENSGVDMYISFDNEKVGELFGKAVCEQFPKGARILELMGSPTDYNVTLVEKGLDRELKKTSHTIVKKEYAKGWVAEHAFDAVSEFYAGGNSCDAIICGNDDMADQAIRALSESRKAGKVFVIGQDGDLTACQRIVEGTQGGTVFKNIDELATRAAEIAVKLGKGEKVAGDRTISDGTTRVPFVCLEPVYVNRETIDEVIIDGGVHTKEDVYLNVKEKE